jgi:hypothetical protein
MAVSSNLALEAPSVQGMEFDSENLNGAGTFVSEKVHLDEIAVSLTAIIRVERLDVARGSRPDRLPIPHGADISAAILPPRSKDKSWRLSVPFRSSSPTRRSAI